jgi:hypothetical protein
LQSNSSRAQLFRKKRGLIRDISGELLRSPEPGEAAGVSYCGTAPAGKLAASIRFIANQPETLQ